MKKSLCTLILIFILLLPLSLASETWYAGKLNCAELFDGTKLGLANKEEPTYDSSKDIFIGGTVLIGEKCYESFKFQDMALAIIYSETKGLALLLQGSGKAEISEEGYLSITQVDSFQGLVDFADPNYQNPYIKGLHDINMDLSRVGYTQTAALMSDAKQYPFIVGNSLGTGEDIYISSDKDFKNALIIKDEGTVILSKWGVECNGCTYTVQGNPTIPIISLTSTSTKTDVTPSHVSLNGEDYVVGGRVQLDNGHFKINKGDSGMVNGVYVHSFTDPVAFYSKMDTPSEKHYIQFTDDELVIHGEGGVFSTALGTGQGGYPTQDFDYTMGERSDYMPADAENQRLVVDMYNGTVHINKKNSYVKTVGEATVTNGVNSILYSPDSSGKMSFNYQYTPCNGHGTTLCEEVPYRLIDGGTVDVKTYVPEEYNQFADVSFQQKGYDDVTYTLDTSKVYVLGYKGGGAARAISSGVIGTTTKEEEYKQWGHMGLLYYRSGEWWVAEADGENVKIVPVDESLFGTDGKRDGLFEVQTNNPQAIIQKVEQDLAGKKYGHLYEGSDIVNPAGVYCSNLVSESLSAAGDVNPLGSFYNVYMSDESTGVVATTLNLVSSVIYDTPTEVLSSGAVVPVAPSKGELINSSALYGSSKEDTVTKSGERK